METVNMNLLIINVNRLLELLNSIHMILNKIVIKQVQLDNYHVLILIQQQQKILNTMIELVTKTK